MPGRFFDTNILIYLASSSPEKAERAEQAVAEGGTISVQVLNEIANVSRRKMGFSWLETNRFLATLRGLLSVVPLSVDIHEAAMRLAERYGYGIYDATILAAALSDGCTSLFSEDMQHRQIIDGTLTIINPFKKA